MSAFTAVAEHETGFALEADGLPAPAKINLALHVTGRRPDGYHTLSSLVAFADIGDRLSLRLAAGDRIETCGPFAQSLANNLTPGARNILAHTLDLARDVARTHGIDLPPLAVTLEKNLPIASGIGGGSADAAALLRRIAAAYPALRPALGEAALRIGADVPMCVEGLASRIEGIGEVVEPLAEFPSVPAVLVNPGVPVSTPLVFSRLACRTNPPMPVLPMLRDARDLCDALQETRNDLEDAAIAIEPVIGEASQTLRDRGAAFARMSGSGATVFGLFIDADAALQAAHDIQAARPEWWVVATRLGDGKEAER